MTPNQDCSNKKGDPDSHQKPAKNKTSLFGAFFCWLQKLNSRLSYLAVEHWLTSSIFILALGFIAFSIQAYFPAIKPATWGYSGALIITLFIIFAALHLLLNESDAEASEAPAFESPGAQS
jgi:hypothetical protein